MGRLLAMVTVTFGLLLPGCVKETGTETPPDPQPTVVPTGAALTDAVIADGRYEAIAEGLATHGGCRPADMPVEAGSGPDDEVFGVVFRSTCPAGARVDLVAVVDVELRVQHVIGVMVGLDGTSGEVRTRGLVVGDDGMVAVIDDFPAYAQAQIEAARAALAAEGASREALSGACDDVSFAGGAQAGVDCTADGCVDCQAAVQTFENWMSQDPGVDFFDSHADGLGTTAALSIILALLGGAAGLGPVGWLAIGVVIGLVWAAYEALEWYQSDWGETAGREMFCNKLVPTRPCDAEPECKSPPRLDDCATGMCEMDGDGHHACPMEPLTP